MADNSKIWWTNATKNPARGCTKPKPSCRHRYEETFAERWRMMNGHPFEFCYDLRLIPQRFKNRSLISLI